MRSQARRLMMAGDKPKPRDTETALLGKKQKQKTCWCWASGTLLWKTCSWESHMTYVYAPLQDHLSWMFEKVGEPLDISTHFTGGKINGWRRQFTQWLGAQVWRPQSWKRIVDAGISWVNQTWLSSSDSVSSPARWDKHYLLGRVVLRLKWDSWWRAEHTKNREKGSPGRSDVTIRRSRKHSASQVCVRYSLASHPRKHTVIEWISTQVYRD